MVSFGRSPTLESVKMVEKTIKKYSQQYGRYQLWKRLPKKMMYQTYQVILDYLEEHGKIMTCKDGIVIWTYNPKLVAMLRKEGLIMATSKKKSRSAAKN